MLARFRYSSRVWITRAPRHVLRAVFRFDGWHTWSVPSRPYVKDIAAYLNSRPAGRRRSAVEIGVGLGDIVHRLRYERRVGLDREEAVIRAARFVARVRRDDIEFAVFSFPDDRLDGRYDAVVMVNWIHNVSPELLRSWVTDMLEKHLEDDGILVIDTVDAPGYRFHHSAEAVSNGCPVRITAIAEYPDGRRLMAIQRA